jgi:hypothetical protein
MKNKKKTKRQKLCADRSEDLTNAIISYMKTKTGRAHMEALAGHWPDTLLRRMIDGKK